MIKFELLEYNHGIRTWGNQVYLISHRVVLIVCDIMILMINLRRLITKYGTLLSLVKVLNLG